MDGASAPPLSPPNQDAEGQDQPQDQDNDNNAPADNQGILPNQPAPQPLLHILPVLQKCCLTHWHLNLSPLGHSLFCTSHPLR